MKRNLMSAMALLAASVFAGATMAEAVDVKFGGQVRERWEYQERDFSKSTDSNTLIGSRVRLDATVSIDDKTSAFIQLQDRRIFGGNSGGVSALNADDSDTNVGMHQAYFALKNVYGTPINLQFGRMEIALDGHRLIGNTDWTTGGQAHDGFLATYAAGDNLFAYAYSKALEAGVTGNSITENNTTKTNDIQAHVVYGNFKGILGGALSLYFIVLDNNVLDGTSGQEKNDMYTTGFRQAGTVAGIDYRGEFYYQWGNAASHATGFERDAYMYGIRAGKNFGGSLQPTLTLWYDYLSGTDSNDISNKKVKSFDTIFDTGHKFYGYMDRFLNIGTTARTGTATSDAVKGLGLRDLAVKGGVKPMENWDFGADLHWFWTAEDMYASLATNDAGNAGKSRLGTELDLTLSHKYSASTKFTFGYSHFWAADLVKDTIGRTGAKSDDADWAYIMMDVRF